MEWLVALGYGLGTFFLVVGVVVLVLGKFSTASATCGTAIGGGDATLNTYNATSGLCQNSSGYPGSAPVNSEFVGLQYGITQLGSSGLLGWTPAIIAIVIGVFFLSYFGIGGTARNRRY